MNVLKKDILPYSYYEKKVKTNTIQSIYLNTRRDKSYGSKKDNSMYFEGRNYKMLAKNKTQINLNKDFIINSNKNNNSTVKKTKIPT